jgi:hypothetical protein
MSQTTETPDIPTSQEPLQQTPPIDNIYISNAWLLKEIDDKHATYQEMTETCFETSSFLDHRIVMSPQARHYRVVVGDVLRSERWLTAAPPFPTRYILHISHVGSTLVSRALGAAPTCLALREPLPLRFLAHRYSELGKSESWLSAKAFRELADFTLRSLGRPLNERRDVVIKCTSWVNVLAPYLLSPTSGGHKRVVAVYSSLDNFVANTLKSAGGVKDLNSQAQSRVRRLSALVPMDLRLHALDAGEIAAMSWLSEMLSIQRACGMHGCDLRWLDFDAFLAAPLAETAALALHLDLPWTEDASADLAESGVLARYSKQQEYIPFSRSSREELLQQFKRDHADLIASANRWIDHQFAQFPELGFAVGAFR